MHDYLSVPPSTAASVLAIHADMAESIMVLGPPGVGKSDLVRQASARTEREVLYFDASTAEPTDVAGLPVPVTLTDGRRVLSRAMLEKYLTNGRVTVFFDELLQGSPSMLNAVAPVFLERRMGDLKLPDTTWIVAASNRPQDRAGISRAPSHLPNRMTVLGLEFCLEDWRAWAAHEGVHPTVVAFSAFRPKSVFDFDPNRIVNATPRQWAWVGKRLEQLKNLPTAARQAILAGRITTGHAAEFLAFHAVQESLPTVEEILEDPMAARCPSIDQLDVRFALVGMLAPITTRQSITRLHMYISRLGAVELTLSWFIEAKMYHPDIITTPEYSKCAKEYLGLMKE